MNSPTLTRTAGLATSRIMANRKTGVLAVKVAVAASLASALGGCITLKAPDKPIVIELNINIKQEVVYRLAADADKTITDNKGVF